MIINGELGKMINKSINDLYFEKAEYLSTSVRLEFNDLHLLNRALTHRSYINENSDVLEDNERLEFLGDAVLDFLVGAWLYKRFPEMQEGELTRLRSALVRTEQLAEFARAIELGHLIHLGKGEEESGGRNKEALLCGTFEALIGALYLDKGIDSVSRFIDPMLENAVAIILSSKKDKDPKSLLQEWVQAQGSEPPEYITILEKGPDHQKEFDVEVIVGGQIVGRGTGRSKQIAAKNAAISAIKNLDIH